jgi:3-oxoacyl-[acyl-carrier-protein] synthase III
MLPDPAAGDLWGRGGGAVRRPDQAAGEETMREAGEETMREAAGTHDRAEVGIGGIAYALPERSLSVRELDAAGLLQSDPALLERFGFARVYAAERESPFELAARAAARLLEEHDVDAGDIGLLVYAGPQGPTAFSTAPDARQCSDSLRTMQRFRYPGTRLQHRLRLDRATVLGVDQGACTNLLSAVRVAAALCVAEDIPRALCVCADFFPADAGREAIFNCTSDAAVAVLVERDAARNRIAGSAHATKGYYWDADARRDEMLAAYFPTAVHVIAAAAARAGWDMRDIDWVIPHNVSRRSWDVLLGLLGVPAERLWHHNIARTGHTLAGDNFINLRDAAAAGAIVPGHRLLLFSYGYGAHWTALAVAA